MPNFLANCGLANFYVKIIFWRSSNYYNYFKENLKMINLGNRGILRHVVIATMKRSKSKKELSFCIRIRHGDVFQKKKQTRTIKEVIF